MDQQQRFKEFKEKYDSLVKEYQMEIRAINQPTLQVFDMAPKEPAEAEVEKVETNDTESNA